MRVPSSCLSVHVYLGYRWKWVHNTSCFLFGDILGRPAEPRANPATLPWCTCHWTARLNAEGIIRKNLLHGSGPHTGVHGSSWGLVFSGFFSLNLSRTPSGACIDNIMHLWGGVLAAHPPPPPPQAGWGKCSSIWLHVEQLTMLSTSGVSSVRFARKVVSLLVLVSSGHKC